MDRMRIAVLGLVFGIGLCGITLTAVAQNGSGSQEFLSVPIGSIEITPPEAVEPQRTAVTFSHSGHFVYNCTTCHHKWKLDAGLQNCTTSNCHDLVKAPKKAAGGNAADVLAIRYYKKAYHQQCIDCHLVIKRQNIALEKSPRFDAKDLKLQNPGPTGCIECHPKE